MDWERLSANDSLGGCGLSECVYSTGFIAIMETGNGHSLVRCTLCPHFDAIR